MTLQHDPEVDSVTTATRPCPHVTHELSNQPPPRVDVDELTTHVCLVEGVRRFDAEWALDLLGEVGRLVGSASFQHDAELANSQTPLGRAHRRGRVPPGLPPDHR